MSHLSKSFLTILILLGIFRAVHGQVDIPVGDWQTHFSYRQGQTLSVTDQWIYYGAENGFLRFDPVGSSPQLLTKLDGFADTGIGALAYEAAADVLAIGYKNGNVDFLTAEGIINQDAILEADIVGDKAINGIDFFEGKAYLSSNFGVVVINLDNFDIRESYLNIGPGGQEVQVQQSAFFNDSIFLATDKGILAGSLDPAYNLLDFNNWYQFGPTDSLAIKSYKGLASADEQLTALSEDDSLFNYRQGAWTPSNRQLAREVNSIQYSGDDLIICASGIIELRTDQGAAVITGELSNPMSAVYGASGSLWIADSDLGLLRYDAGSIENFTPDGPFSDRSFVIYSAGDEQIVLPGGYDRFGNAEGITDGFSVLKEGQWYNYNATGLSGSIEIPEVQDLVDVCGDPSGNRYFASFGDGILQWNGDEAFTVIDENANGSTLQPTFTNPDKVEIGGIAIDREGLIWITNHNTYVPLHTWDGTNNWNVTKTFTYPRYPTGITLDRSSNKWLKLNPLTESGLLVVDSDESVWRNLTTQNNNGNLPDNKVTSLSLDRDGQMWIGTAKGVAYFPVPARVLSYTGDPENPVFDAVNVVYPIFENRVLLRNEYITAIAVDLGNRKWIGTRKGIWLFSASGDALFSFFNSENSPLPSDNITAIGIDEETGLVYIGTDKGMVSYRGTSTRGESSFGDVKIFPNPVRPNFAGLISISGLVQDSIVKITDVSGKLVYETRAYGGTATWNGADYNGTRATTGIYLVFIASEDGSETFVGKIAMVN